MRPTIALAALLASASAVRADPVPSCVPYASHTAEIPSGEDKIVCVAGDTLHLSGHYINPGYAQVLLVSDRRPVAVVEPGVGLGDAADYSFRWKPSEAGLHRVRILGQAEHGGQTPLRSMTVRVITSAPGTFSALPESTFADVQVKVIMHGADFAPARAAFTFAGKSVSCTPDGLSASLPASAQPTGVYNCAVQTWDADGEFFDVGAASLSVGERVALTSPGTFTLAAPGGVMPLTVDVKPGLSVKSVSYWLDGQKLATATAVPFSGAGDLSALTSGPKTLKAHVVMVDGNEFDSAPLALVFKNQVQEDKDATTAKQQADRDAAVAIAQARALAAAEAAKDAGPTGPARRLLRSYFQTHPELQMTLQDVSDVRKSDSEIYPSDIYALVIEPGLAPMRIIFSANMASQTVSDLTKQW